MGGGGGGQTPANLKLRPTVPPTASKIRRGRGVFDPARHLPAYFLVVACERQQRERQQAMNKLTCLLALHILCCHAIAEISLLDEVMAEAVERFEHERSQPVSATGVAFLQFGVAQETVASTSDIFRADNRSAFGPLGLVPPGSSWGCISQLAYVRVRW
jgi:hypothetical protein